MISIRITVAGLLLAGIIAQPEKVYPKPLINPEGWPLPVLGKELGRSEKAVEGTPLKVTTIRYKAAGTVGLPTNRIDKDGKLLVVYVFFRADEVNSLASNGCIFGYDAVLVGTQVGVAGRASWRDSSGDGIFDTLSWNNQDATIPSWVGNVKAHSCKSVAVE